ncbi:hypothetical protein [Egicoccus sp. AB-alg2]|uniref:hypothetical protein n=1 Tax=Egicoccus sp. AB-alg2 TaxID=3242693 RepID=UPI00359CBBF3
MTRRLLRALPPAVLLLLALPVAAGAAGAALRAPADGVVTGAGDLVVRVTTDRMEVLEHIEVSLRRGDAEVTDAQRPVLCDGREACSQREADHVLAFDPRSGAPFLTDTARILPNGSYVLRLHLARPLARERDTLDLPITLSAPPSAPADVVGDLDGDEVVLRWAPAPEPDVTGYRVEHARNGDWAVLADLPADATTLGDRPGPGRHAYRLVALRPDGRGATYEAASPEVVVEVAPSTGAGPAPDDPAAVGDGASRDGSGGDPAGGDGESQPNPEAGAGDGTHRDADGRPDARPRATPPDVPTGSADIPSLETDPRTATSDGATQDDDFGRTLDYGDRSEVEPDGEVVVASPETRAARGGWSGGGDAVLPVAGGLLFTAAGLRLWRWTRASRQP